MISLLINHIKEDIHKINQKIKYKFSDNVIDTRLITIYYCNENNSMITKTLLSDSLQHLTSSICYWVNPESGCLVVEEYLGYKDGGSEYDRLYKLEI
jgi:hypothetical protein